MTKFGSKLEIALLTVISIILIVIGIEALDIYEKSRYRSFTLRTIGFLLLVSGIKIFVSFAEIVFVPESVRKNIRHLNRNAF